MSDENKLLSKSAQSVQQALTKKGLAFEVLELSASTRTASDAANTIGCGVAQIIKSLLSSRIIMRKIFWDNPYQSDLETRVVSVDNNYVLFEETIAFSFSGGQESDHAYVNGLPVIASEIDGNMYFKMGITLSQVM